jgi:uncharacterized protein (TIGR02147 family)
MEKNLFSFTDYKAYLRAKLGQKSARRGLKTGLAQALACQPTYISQVLNNLAHLSLEQAYAANDFFGHSPEESHFFLLLVQKDRAGNQALKSYFRGQLDELLERRLNLANRLGRQNALAPEKQTTFYSSWHYAAIHLALTVPALRTKEALARYFRLPVKKVAAVVEFLVECGLAEQRGEQFQTGSSVLRIGNDSPHIQKHHANWRTQALESLDREELHDLHYSAAVSLSLADVRRLKSQLLDQIKENLAVVRDSKEEEVFVYCVDFFGLRK